MTDLAKTLDDVASSLQMFPAVVIRTVIEGRIAAYFEEKEGPEFAQKYLDALGLVDEAEEVEAFLP